MKEMEREQKERENRDTKRNFTNAVHYFPPPKL